MTSKYNTEELNEIVRQGLENYRAAVDADEEERAKAIFDASFIGDEDGQWDDLAKLRRARKPRYTIDKLSAAVNEIIGNYKQNRIEIKARAENDSDQDETEAYNGLIRAITNTQDANLAQGVAFKSITVGGIGAFRVLNDYTEDNPFEQDVCITPIWEATESTWFDPAAKHPTAKDGMFQFEETTMTKKSFIAKWPDASLIEWPDSTVSGLQNGWGLGRGSETVRVVDYYVKEPVDIDKVLLSDGSIMALDDYELTKDELSADGITFADAKTVSTFKVMHYKMNGTEVLEEPVEVPSKYLPIIRVLGYYEWRNGTLHYRGVVRKAIDPQRVYNYATSANIEATALKPKDKVLATKAMVGTNISSWRNMNNSEESVLLYEPDAKAPDGKPIPLIMGQGTPELMQQAQQAELDLQSTIGRRAPAQGESATDRSGRAILALQKQDDSVTFELLDNLRISWEHAAQVVMDMLPRVVDTERQVQILKDDGEEDIVTINETVVDQQTGKEVRKNDTSKRYRIKASVGPAFETKRSEAVNVLSTLSQDPQYGVMVPDLLAKSLDFPFAQELSKRFRKPMLAQGIVEPSDEEIAEMQEFSQTPEGQQKAALDQQIQQMQLETQFESLKRIKLENANLEANIANLQAATMEKLNSGRKDNADISETRVDVYTKQLDVMLRQIAAGIQTTPAQMESITSSLQLLDATQRDDYNQRLQEAIAQSQQLQQPV